MANNYQQVPFWDFVRAFDHSGEGVDHPAAGAFPFFAAAPPAAQGEAGPSHPHPPPPPHGGFPFGGGPAFWGPHAFGPEPWGRFGRRGRHCRRGDENDEHTPHGSRSPSPNAENPEGDAREGSPEGPAGPHGRHGRHGHHGHHGHHGPRGFGHPGRGRGGGGGRGGWGGRGGHRGPPPSAVPGGFDLSALFESLSAHPLAQAFRTFAEAQRSGETLVPEDTDIENTFIPPVDVFSTEKEYVLHVALPGAKKEDVGVNWDAEKGVLNLAGVVYRQGDEEFLKSLTKSERKVGVFDRTVKLPTQDEEKEEIDGDAISAKLEDGVLVVIVPKVEKEWTEVKKVDIE